MSPLTDGLQRDKTVSIVVRTLDGRLEFLERALFSLYCDYYPDKQVVLVYQGSDPAYPGKLEVFKEIYPDISLKIIQNSTEKDERARNLNLGLENSDGRYICFLDDDDVIYPNHLSVLSSALRHSGKAWAYSQVCVDFEDRGYVLRKDSVYFRERFSFKALWKENFVPLHGFMIDRHGITDKSLLHFDEKMSRMEDYAFLLKLAFYFEPFRCEETTHIYKIRTDGSNSVEYPRTIRPEWEIAVARIAEIKENIAPDYYWFKELMAPDMDTERILAKKEHIMAEQERIIAKYESRLIYIPALKKLERNFRRKVIHPLRDLFSSKEKS